MAIRSLPGVKVYVSNGTTYAYHRASGIRLLSLYGSPQFLIELASAEKSHQLKLNMAPVEKPGTWGELVSVYRAAKFLPTEAGDAPDLSPRTIADYQKIFDYLQPLHDMTFEQFDRPFVFALRDKTYQKHKRKFANYVVQVICSTFNWAVKRGLVDTNPALNIEKVKRPKNMPRANRPWTDAEWEIVTSRAPKHLLAPILLAGVTGWREGEMACRPRTDYDHQNLKIKRVSLKSGKIVKTSVPREVAGALNALFPHQATTLLVNSLGRPWTQAGMRSSIFVFLKKLERDGLVGPGLTIHGLRHRAATWLRRMGYDLQTIADWLGQTELGVTEIYCLEADLEEKLSAVVLTIDGRNT